MKNYLRGLWQRCLTVTSNELTTENLMDDKKNNFIINGVSRKKKWIFCLKISDHKQIIKQKFIDEKDKKTEVGF